MATSLISQSQKEFIVSSIKNNFRTDGRANAEPQKYFTKVNNLDHLLGSCLLNIKNSQNQVHIYTGLKIRVEKYSGSTKQKSNTFELKNIKDRVTLELGCIKKLSQQEEQTRAYLEEYLNKYVVSNYLTQFQNLLSIPQAKRHYLSISIEAYILSSPHISYLQYLHQCIKTAIQNIEMPSFSVAFNQVTDEEIVEVNQVDRNENSSNLENQKINESRQIYKGLESIKIVGVLGQSYVLGMTVDEYESVDSCILVAFDNEKNIIGFQSLKGTLKVQQIHQIIKFAKN